MKIKIEWKAKTAQFASGQNAYLGPIKVGSTHWASSKQPGGPWQASTLLPGMWILESTRNHSNEADARKIVEYAVQKWFDTIEPAIIKRARTPQKSED